MKSAEAALELARLQLSYTRVVAPADGFVSEVGATRTSAAEPAEFLRDRAPLLASGHPGDPTSMPHLDRRAILRSAVLVLGLLALSLADPNGLRKALRNEREVLRLERENAALEQRVMQLRREAKALHGDPAAVERAAREELGYVRPGELVYKLDEVAP